MVKVHGEDARARSPWKGQKSADIMPSHNQRVCNMRPEYLPQMKVASPPESALIRHTLSPNSASLNGFAKRTKRRDRHQFYLVPARFEAAQNTKRRLLHSAQIGTLNDI
jgi:hypothetical protein